MLVDIKDYFEEKGCTPDEVYNGVIAYIISSNKYQYIVDGSDVAVLEWRTTLHDADSYQNQNKALEEEMFCIGLSEWCEEHGMLFRSDAGLVEESEFEPVRGFDRKLLIPGREYLRIIGECYEPKEAVNIKRHQF